MALEPGTMEPSCVIASGGIRGDGRLTVSHAHGSVKTLYKTFVCFKMGVFVKESGSYRPDYLHRIVCSEFPLHRLDSGSLSSTLKSMSRPLPCSFPAERQSFSKKDYIPHVHFRFRPGTRMWVKSSLIATIWAFNIRRFEGAIP